MLPGSRSGARRRTIAIVAPDSTRSGAVSPGRTAVPTSTDIGGDSHDRSAGAPDPRRAAAPSPPGAEGLPLPRDAAHDGPEADRLPVPGHVVRVLHGRRGDGDAHPRGGGPTGAAVPEHRTVQPAVHHARHDHAAALRNSHPVRLRQLHRAAADRRTRRRVPPAQRLLLLAVPVRRPHRALGLPHPGRRCRLRLVRLHAAVRRCPLARYRRGPLGDGPGHQRARHDPRRRQLHHHDHVLACPRHDDVPDAGLHVDDPAHRVPDPARVPDPHRGAARAGGRPALRGTRVRPRPRRRDPLAAPVLVLRPSRGLHRGVALLRHHL